MRTIHIYPLSVATLFLVLTLFCVQAQSSENKTEEGLNGDTIISELEKQMDLSREKWEQLKPVLEEKSKALSESLKKSIDEGVVDLNNMAEKFDQMSKDAEKKVKDILSSEEAQKFREQLSRVDREAIAQVKEKMITDLHDLLELTEDQIAELKPVFEESFDRLSVMVQGLAVEGTANWEKFREDFEAVSKDLFDKVRETLDDDQMKKLEEYKNQEKEEIRQVIFNA